MTPKLPRATAVDILRALANVGWQEARRSGSHAILVHPQRQGIVVVPFHKGKDLPTGTIARIVRDAGLTPDELRRLL